MLKELSSTCDKHYQDTSCIFTKVIGQIIESTKFVNPDLVAKRIPINLKGLQSHKLPKINFISNLIIF